MKRRKIACLIIALIITTLLTGCSLGDIPVIGKYLSKDSDVQTDAPASDQTDIAGDDFNDMPHIDAEYPAVPVGTTITVNDIFNLLSPVGLSAETVAGYLIISADGNEVEALTVTEDTYFTFIYQMRDAEANEQSQMVIRVTVTGESMADDGFDDFSQDESQAAVETPQEPQGPTAVKYEVFKYDDVTSDVFSFSAMSAGGVYISNVLDFDIHRINHSYEYENIAKKLSDLTSSYTDIDANIAGKFMAYCIPKAYVYMQAPDYEEGADMSVYNGEYVIVLEPVYEDYTDEIYQSEDVLILSLIDDVNNLAKEPSDEAKQECDFLMDETFDDESDEAPDFYGAMEIIMQLANTEDIFIFDDILKAKVVDYSDMATPDNMSDDVTWDEYEAGVVSGAQETPIEEEQGAEQSGESSSTTTTSSTTTVTETTTTTTTSVIQAINDEVANSFRSRHPELFTFFPETEQVYSKWDWRIDDSTTVKGTVTLKDGTIIPQLSNSNENNTIYNITDGTSSTRGTGNSTGNRGTSGSVFSSTPSATEEPSTGTSFSSTTLGDEGYETEEPEEEEELTKYEISLGNTKCTVTSNNTYRYMIDSQNSSSSEVYVNHRDDRYTIKIVDENTFSNYWLNDHLHRSANGHTISPDKSYTGYTDADNTTIVLMNILYKSTVGDVTEPYMAYIRNGSEYIIILPDKAESTGSDTLADILKRCVALK